MDDRRITGSPVDPSRSEGTSPPSLSNRLLLRPPSPQYTPTAVRSRFHGLELTTLEPRVQTSSDAYQNGEQTVPGPQLAPLQLRYVYGTNRTHEQYTGIDRRLRRSSSPELGVQASAQPVMSTAPATGFAPFEPARYAVAPSNDASGTRVDSPTFAPLSPTLQQQWLDAAYPVEQANLPALALDSVQDRPRTYLPPLEPHVSASRRTPDPNYVHRAGFAPTYAPWDAQAGDAAPRDAVPELAMDERNDVDSEGEDDVQDDDAVADEEEEVRYTEAYMRSAFAAGVELDTVTAAAGDEIGDARRQRDWWRKYRRLNRAFAWWRLRYGIIYIRP